MKFLIAPGVDPFIVTHLSRAFVHDSVDTETLPSLWESAEGNPADIEEYVQTLTSSEQLAIPRCIIQRVWYSELRMERAKHFLFVQGEKTYTTRSNPLLYRRTLFEVDQDRKCIERFRDCSLPIIFIGDFALSCPQQPGEDENPTTRIYPPGGSDKLFLDSSIWHRYIPIWELPRLQDIIEDTKNLNERGIYQTTVALEDLDYSIRMLRSQYVEDFKGHGAQIGVHAFHSEAQAASTVRSITTANVIGIQTEPNKDGEKRLRILLVDDYALIPLRQFEPDSDENPGRTKEACVKRLFSDPRGIHISSEFVSVATFEEALDELEKQRFDIILLDYLFTIDSDRKHLPVPAYGNNFLKRLGGGTKKLFRGPGDEFWIMPATVFPEAIRSEVDSANISRDEAEYTLFSGADPICTPELFKRKFLKMVEIITREISPSLDPFIDLLMALKKAPSGDVRSECRKTFPRVVDHCGRYNQLQEDAEDAEGSRLAKFLLDHSILDVREKGELLVRIRSFLNDFVYGGDQKWASLHLEFDYISRHPLLLRDVDTQEDTDTIQAGLRVLLDEINRKAERG